MPTEQARVERSKAYEAKWKLDKLNVFADYADRFLDLFNGLSVRPNANAFREIRRGRRAAPRHAICIPKDWGCLNPVVTERTLANAIAAGGEPCRLKML
jgi:hypothetical protein